MDTVVYGDEQRMFRSDSMVIWTYIVRNLYKGLFRTLRIILPHQWNITLKYKKKQHTTTIKKKVFNSNPTPVQKKITGWATMSPTINSNGQATTFETDWWRSRHAVWGLTHCRAIKEGSKVINHNRVNNHACSLLHTCNISNERF